MLTFVYYLHWLLIGLVGLAGLMVVFKPNLLARIFFIGFLVQQLILNGCIMTLWENHIKANMGVELGVHQFIMAHIVSAELVPWFKLLFVVVIALQLYELRKETQWDFGNNYTSTVRMANVRVQR